MTPSGCGRPAPIVGATRWRGQGRAARSPWAIRPGSGGGHRPAGLFVVFGDWASHEFLEFPARAAGADVRFAEAAGWARPIRFARGAGGHAPGLEVSRLARDAGVSALVFAHVGRPTIKALDGGLTVEFGNIGVQRLTYRLP